MAAQGVADGAAHKLQTFLFKTHHQPKQHEHASRRFPRPDYRRRPRTSTNYTIVTDTTDAGGKKTSSAAYSIDASIGGVAGIATATPPSETAKTGYIAQLYEVIDQSATGAKKFYHVEITKP